MCALHFSDWLVKAGTHPIDLQLVFHGQEAPFLSLVKEAATARQQACGRECLQLVEQATAGHHLRWFEQYHELLQELVTSSSEQGGHVGVSGGDTMAGTVAFQWTSPLSAPPADSQLNSLGCSPLVEQIMSLHMFAAVMQEQAHLQGRAMTEAQDQGSSWGGASSSSGSGSGSGVSIARANAEKQKPQKKGRGLAGLFSFRRRVTGSPGAANSQPESPGGSPYSARSYSYSPASTCSGSPLGGAVSARCASASASASACAGSPFAEGRPLSPAAETAAGETRSGRGGEDGQAHASMAAMYRRAAGVMELISQELLPAAQAARALPHDSPVELWPGVAEAMAGLCLSQAQGVAAQRAGAKGTSPALAAALHVGAAELFVEASVLVQAIQPPAQGSTHTVSARLCRFPLICTLWHKAAAHRQLALEQRTQEQLGQAVASVSAAVANMLQALAKCDKEDDADWQAELRAELAALQKLHVELDRERSVVFLQQVAVAATGLPAGKVIVTALQYSPARLCAGGL